MYLGCSAAVKSMDPVFRVDFLRSSVGKHSEEYYHQQEEQNNIYHGNALDLLLLLCSKYDLIVMI